MEKLQTALTWIPCESELPDDGMVVLVALESGLEPVWLGYYDSAESDWFNSDGMRFAAAVSHWSEMPQATVAVPASHDRYVDLLPCPCGHGAGVIPDNSYGSCIIACSVEDCDQSEPVVDYARNLTDGIEHWNMARQLSIQTTDGQ